MNVKEASKKWNIPERTIRNYCMHGLILGAFRNGKSWFIPNDAENPSDSVFFLKKPSLLQSLKREKELKEKGGIYHKLQVEMTYNSNHIEGSKLSKEETELIFETRTIGHTSTNLGIDDIIETSNHFKCVNYVIDNCKKKLTEKLIKDLHTILKRSTSDEELSWFNVGEYKKLPNEVGGQDTTNPENVHLEVKKLIDEYESIKTKKIEDIIEFHVKFERIHPFQDGNGRIGRLIILKECLRYGIVPILIQDDFKDFYYRGLREWNYEKGYLIDTCLYGQDIFKKYLDYFRIKY